MTPQEIEIIRDIFREELRVALGLQAAPAPPSADPWAHVRALAKTDPMASMKEAKRLSREDSLRRREEKKRRKAA